MTGITILDSPPFFSSLPLPPSFMTTNPSNFN